MDFRVNLDVFRGPLELLLYLVRKHELDVLDVRVADIAAQFVTELTTRQTVNFDEVGEFLEIASTLAEIKSRLVLPRGGEEVEEFEDPREDLVERLLEYKKYRDAASILEERSRAWQQRIPRLSPELPPRQIAPESQPILELELWDLVSAFGRIMRDTFRTQPASIVYDDTPIHVYMSRIHERLVQQRRLAFSDMFVPGMHKSAMVGVFLAVLELVRNHNVITEQQELHGEIWVVAGEAFVDSFDLSRYDTSTVPLVDLEGTTIRPK